MPSHYPSEPPPSAASVILFYVAVTAGIVMCARYIHRPDPTFGDVRVGDGPQYRTICNSPGTVTDLMHRGWKLHGNPTGEYSVCQALTHDGAPNVP